MNSSLFRGPLGAVLVGTLLLSAWAYWWPRSQSAQGLVQAVERVGAAAQSAQDQIAAVGDRAVVSTATAALPATLEAAELAAARRDPFEPYVPPPPPAPTPPKLASPPPPLPVPLPPPPIAMAPPAPAAPTPAYRFLGRFVSPAGQLTVYIEGPGGVPVPVSAGTRLDGGFVVTSIADDAIELSYPAIDGYKARIAVPPRAGG